MMDLDLFVGLLIVKNCQKRILLLAFTYSAIFLSPNLLALTSSIEVIIDKFLSVKGLQIEIPWFWTIKRTSNRSWDCQKGEIVTVFFWNSISSFSGSPSLNSPGKVSVNNFLFSRKFANLAKVFCCNLRSIISTLLSRKILRRDSYLQII